MFLIGNLSAFNGTEALLDGHVAESVALFLLGALALYAAVLVVMRIRARPTPVGVESASVAGDPRGAVDSRR